MFPALGGDGRSARAEECALCVDGALATAKGASDAGGRPATAGETADLLDVNGGSAPAWPFVREGDGDATVAEMEHEEDGEGLADQLDKAAHVAGLAGYREPRPPDQRAKAVGVVAAEALHEDGGRACHWTRTAISFEP